MLRHWCKQHGFYNADATSHVLMDGGILSIPYDKIPEFYQVYTACVQRKEHVFVVEQKTPCYNFFLDIDYQDPDALTLEQVQGICEIICDQVSQYGGDRAIVSIQEPRMKAGVMKSGIHINWPKLVVDQEGALNLMHHVINRLYDVYPARHWSKDIDSSVYTGAGFRLPWSHKKSKCLEGPCHKCRGTGKLVEGYYIPVLKYEHGKLEEDVAEISVEMLMNVTLRTTETVGTPIPTAVPRERDGDKKRKYQNEEGNFTKNQVKKDVSSPLLNGAIQDFLRKVKDRAFKEIYANTCVLNVYMAEKGTFFVRTNSKYCENLGREHGSNHIYFLIRNMQIEQRCFCRCDTLKGRRDGLCRDFRGQSHKLPPSVIRLLEGLRETKKPVLKIK